MKRELTQRQADFIEGYVSHGDATRAATEAGYAHPQKDGSRLKKELAKEIERAVREEFAEGAPMALRALRDVIEHGSNESARMRAIDSWLDRSGFKPVDKHEDVTAAAETEDETFARMRHVMGDAATLAFMRHKGWPESFIRKHLGDAYTAPDEPRRPEYHVEPEHQSEKQRRTLAEQCAERKRLRDADKLKKQQAQAYQASLAAAKSREVH